MSKYVYIGTTSEIRHKASLNLIWQSCKKYIVGLVKHRKEYAGNNNTWLPTYLTCTRVDFGQAEGRNKIKNT